MVSSATAERAAVMSGRAGVLARLSAQSTTSTRRSALAVIALRPASALLTCVFQLGAG